MYFYIKFISLFFKLSIRIIHCKQSHKNCQNVAEAFVFYLYSGEFSLSLRIISETLYFKPPENSKYKDLLAAITNLTSFCDHNILESWATMKLT